MITSPYFALLLFFIVSTTFLGSLIFLAIFLGPKNPTRTKQLPFECGSVSVGNPSKDRFFVRFYLVAMIFILFDVEIIFMYPWAVNLKALGTKGLLEIVLFNVVLVSGLIFIWKRGILDWNKH